MPQFVVGRPYTPQQLLKTTVEGVYYNWDDVGSCWKWNFGALSGIPIASASLHRLQEKAGQSRNGMYTAQVHYTLVTELNVDVRYGQHAVLGQIKEKK